MSGGKFKGGIPGSTDAREAEIESFVGAAPGKASLQPWETTPVRQELTMQLNVRQPGDLLRKLDWLAYQTGVNKREIVERALVAEIDREFKRLGAKP